MLNVFAAIGLVATIYFTCRIIASVIVGIINAKTKLWETYGK